MEKKELKVRYNVILKNIGVGIGWITMGISNCFPNIGAMNVMDGMGMVIFGVFFLIPFFMRQEDPDEMSDRHYEMAEAMGYRVLGMGLVALVLIDHTPVPALPMGGIAEILFGLGSIAVGLYFSHLEKKGEPWQS